MIKTPSVAPLTFKVKGNDYSVSRITIGNLMKIEIAKAELAGGKYGQILANKTTWSEYTLDNIDMFAHLYVFFPSLITDLKVDSWEDLDPFDLKELKDQYRDQFTPWFSTFVELLRKPIVADVPDK